MLKSAVLILLLFPGLLSAEMNPEALQTGAEQGDAWAQLNLGAAYDNGMGVDRDVEKAILWYRQAAEQGLAEAQFNLAHILVEEEINTAEAAEWMARAAAQGMPDAEYLMGVIYAEGIGVERDDAEALRWLQKAIEQGHADAKQFMNTHYRPVEADD